MAPVPQLPLSSNVLYFHLLISPFLPVLVCAEADPIVRSLSSAPMADETAARQEAALCALRLLDSHVRSVAFHAGSPHAHSPAPLPPHFLPVVPPMAV